MTSQAVPFAGEWANSGTVRPVFLTGAHRRGPGGASLPSSFVDEAKGQMSAYVHLR